MFDVYLEKEELPEYMQGDVLAKYIKEVLDDPGNRYLCKTDPIWKDLLKSSLLDFFRQLLPNIMKLEKDIRRLYPPSDVNMEGYIQLMKEQKISRDLIFNALVGDWSDACEKRITKKKQKLLDYYKEHFITQAKLAGNEDYKTIKKKTDVLSVTLNSICHFHIQGKRWKRNRKKEPAFMVCR